MTLVPQSLRPSAPDLKRVAARLAFIAAAVALWQIVVVVGILPADAVAPPTTVVMALGGLITTPAFWVSVGGTAVDWGVGTAIALMIAVPIGLLLGASNLLYRMFRVTIDFLRTVPPVALLPLALLLYGATSSMAILLVVLGSMWPVLLQSMYGVHQVDPVMRDVASSYRLSRRDRVVRVIIPSAAPFIATGIRVAATIGLLLAVGAEMLGGAPGLGSAITTAQQATDVPGLYARVVVVALLGVALNLAMLTLERRVLSWHSSHRPAATG